ncbi:MAG: GNAT family N-acetyltransferase [Candidatus Peregrinibacteria bacterium]
MPPSKRSSRVNVPVNIGEVNIREMELDDLPVIFSLGEKLFTPEKWPVLYRSWDQYEVAELFDSDGEFCLVAEVDGRIIGFALGTLIEKPHSAWSYGYLLWLGVSRAFSRKGVATKLTSKLTQLFIENGARMMLVDTAAQNTVALRFFKQSGFHNEIPHVYLSQNLTTHPVYVKKRLHRAKRCAHCMNRFRKLARKVL